MADESEWIRNRGKCYGFGIAASQSDGKSDDDFLRIMN